jgi:hypothetical protein
LPMSEKEPEIISSKLTPLPRTLFWSLLTNDRGYWLFLGSDKSWV